MALAGSILRLAHRRALGVGGDRLKLGEGRFRVSFAEQAIAEAHADLVGQLRGRLLIDGIAQQFDGRVVLAALAEQFGQLEEGVGVEAEIRERLE